ncbi:MAG: hypothetical protein U0K38_09440 [Collinsella sp.]|nr:hypothetical protein [Collinsella sp.]
MITDKERHEIAERMRGYDVSEFKESTIVPFLDCLGRGYTGWRGILDKLADLIDRPTCATVESYMGDNLESVEETPHHVLSCGHIAYGEDDPMFCPVCGAAVTDDYR